MPELVALDLPGGPAFVEALKRTWDQGDAAFPLDQRLSGPARAEALVAALPTRIVGADGEQRVLTAGRGVEVGDALVVATSGTSGASKAVVLTHEAVRASALATSNRLEVDRSRDQWLACLPLAHVGGLSVVTRALVTDTSLVVLDAFDEDAIARVARAAPTLISLVPTTLDRTDAALFKKVLLGGSSDWRERPANVVRTYGMTESGSGVVYDHIPLDGVDVRVVNGEIHLRGPMMLRCYRDGTDPKVDNGWYPTGDLGAWDGTRLDVFGRKGDLIITGGENVWPARVEEVLAAHPGVVDVTVFGRPDDTWGKRVVARVVPAEQASPPSLDELRTWVKDRLPAYCAPRELELTSSLARTSLGKVRRLGSSDGRR